MLNLKIEVIKVMNLLSNHVLGNAHLDFHNCLCLGKEGSIKQKDCTTVNLW